MDNETLIDEATFDYNGFICTVTKRPDLHFMWQVYGHRKSDNKDIWPGYDRGVPIPGVLFEQNLTFEQIRDTAISMMDGTFGGKVETYGNVVAYAG